MIDEALVKAVATVGFPIVAFIMIYYQSNNTIKENTKAIREMIIYLRDKRDNK